MRESERDIQNAQPPPSEPNSPTFGAFTTPARNGDSIDLIRPGRPERPESVSAEGTSSPMHSGRSGAQKTNNRDGFKPMEGEEKKEGRMSAPLMRTTREIFQRRLREHYIGNFGLNLSHPAPRGRMLLFRSAPEITNESEVDATLFGTGSRHQRGRSATATIRLSSSPLSSPSVFFLSPEVRIWG